MSDEAAAPTTRQVRTRRASSTSRPTGRGGTPRAGSAPAAESASRRSWRAERHQRRLRARKVTRIVRHIDPFSVLKAGLVFYFCLWAIFLISGALLWRVSVESGVIDNIESFIRDLFAEETFKLDGSQLFRAYAIGGLLMVLVSTGFTVLFAILFNLISDLVGGIRLSVIQEETARETDY